MFKKILLFCTILLLLPLSAFAQEEVFETENNQNAVSDTVSIDDDTETNNDQVIEPTF